MRKKELTATDLLEIITWLALMLAIVLICSQCTTTINVTTTYKHTKTK